MVYCVDQLPLKYLPDDVARIRCVIESAIYIEMDGVCPENSHEKWEKLTNQSEVLQCPFSLIIVL